MRAPPIRVIFAVALALLTPQLARAQEGLERRVTDLETRVDNLRPAIQEHGPSGGLVILFGAFCALWAQNTNRNAWLWFFLGLFFSVITVIVLLAKNSADRQRLRGSPRPVEQNPAAARIVRMSLAPEAT
jgi:hypothetical protein